MDSEDFVVAKTFENSCKDDGSRPVDSIVLMRRPVFTEINLALGDDRRGPSG